MRRKLSAAFLALSLSLTLAGPACAADTSFPDVPAGAWYEEAVDYCLERGLMIGADGLFQLEDVMTRAMAAQVLCQAAGSPVPEGEGAFPDVSREDWYADAAQWAFEAGLMIGDEHGHFLGESPVTREQFTAILWRYAGTEAASGGADGFADGAEIALYAREAVDWAAEHAVVIGFPDGRFAPRENVTRAQAAVMLMRSQRLSLCGSVPLSAPEDGPIEPCGIAPAEDGLILTDLYSRKVWLVRDGARTLLAGGDTAPDVGGRPVGGYHDGPVDRCSFRLPWAVAPFLDGWAVSDAENNAVRLITGGNVQTLNCTAGEQGIPTQRGRVSFAYPTGLAADGDGNLYVSDTHRGAIRRITPEGVASTVADGLSDPMGLCWSGGALYVAETGANRIVKIEDGAVSLVAGSGEDGAADGSAAEASFAFPQGVAVDRDGTVYVADTGNGAIRRIRNGETSTLFSRDKHWEQEDLLSPAAPTGLLLAGKTLYVCDSFNRAVYVIAL